MSVETSAEISQLAADIQARIANLANLFEDPLEAEMDSLKECIIQNPSAAALLKDEDVGLLVTSLRRTVAADIQKAVEGKKKPVAGKKKFTQEELEAALAAEGL